MEDYDLLFLCFALLMSYKIPQFSLILHLIIYPVQRTGITLVTKNLLS